MAILDFQKPDKVVMINSDDYNGTFEFRPLEPGYGITVGNALRRVLLNSLEGFAVTAVTWWWWAIFTIRYLIQTLTRASANLGEVKEEVILIKEELAELKDDE